MQAIRHSSMMSGNLSRYLILDLNNFIGFPELSTLTNLVYVRSGLSPEFRGWHGRFYLASLYFADDIPARTDTCCHQQAIEFEFQLQHGWNYSSQPVGPARTSVRRFCRSFASKPNMCAMRASCNESCVRQLPRLLDCHWYSMFSPLCIHQNVAAQAKWVYRYIAIPAHCIDCDDVSYRLGYHAVRHRSQ